MKLRNYPQLVAVILLFIAPCFAQTQFPETPAGKQAKAWLESFNAGDAEKHKEFLRKNAPTRLERFDREMQVRQMSRGFDVRKVEESTPTKMLALLQERARLIQYQVAVDDKKLIFQPVPSDKSEVLTMTLKEHLLEFYPRLTAVGQVGEVNVRGWNPKEKKEFVGKAKQGDEKSAMGGKSSGAKLADAAFGAAVALVSSQPVLAQAEADQIAKALFNETALELITGEGVCLGRTDLRAGKVIKIDEIGKRFSGQYYITSAAHSYQAGGGYMTYFTVRRSAS